MSSIEWISGTTTAVAPRQPGVRRQVWRPSLVRAGLLGHVAKVGPFKFRATQPDRDGVGWSAEFTTEREAADGGADDPLTTKDDPQSGGKPIEGDGNP